MRSKEPGSGLRSESSSDFRATFGRLERLEYVAHKLRRCGSGRVLHADARAHHGDPILTLDAEREFVVDRTARVFAEESVECLASAMLVNVIDRSP